MFRVVVAFDQQGCGVVRYVHILRENILVPAQDIVYFTAYVIFLVGSSLTLRQIRPVVSLWVMVTGVLIDFFATILPNAGFKSLAIGIGSSPEILAGITLGVLVWTVFLAAVFVRLMGRQSLYYSIIVAIKIMWFVDLVLLMYGVYTIKA